MARKPQEVNEHQGSLLEVVDKPVGAVEVPHFPDDPAAKLLGQPSDYEVVYGPPGTYVDVQVRAEHLTDALSAFAKRNQRLGFDLASNTRKYDAPIWARYREFVPRVQDGAERNVDKFLEASKKSFWQATGYAALRNTDLAPRKELDAAARKMWREFSTQYGDPDKRKKRDRYKSTLRRAMRTSKRIVAKQVA